MKGEFKGGLKGGKELTGMVVETHMSPEDPDVKVIVISLQGKGMRRDPLYVTDLEGLRKLGDGILDYWDRARALGEKP